MTVIRSALLRAARTWLSTFLAVLTASPLLSINVSVVKTAAVAGMASVLTVAQRALDEAPGVPTIPPG